MDPPQLAGLDPAGDAGVGEASGSELVGGDEIALPGGDLPRGMPRGFAWRKSAGIPPGSSRLPLRIKARFAPKPCRKARGLDQTVEEGRGAGVQRHMARAARPRSGAELTRAGQPSQLPSSRAYPRRRRSSNGPGTALQTRWMPFRLLRSRSLGSSEHATHDGGPPPSRQWARTPNYWSTRRTSRRDVVLQVGRRRRRGSARTAPRSPAPRTPAATRRARPGAPSAAWSAARRARPCRRPPCSRAPAPRRGPRAGCPPPARAAGPAPPRATGPCRRARSAPVADAPRSTTAACLQTRGRAPRSRRSPPQALPRRGPARATSAPASRRSVHATPRRTLRSWPIAAADVWSCPVTSPTTTFSRPSGPRNASYQSPPTRARSADGR